MYIKGGIQDNCKVLWQLCLISSIHSLKWVHCLNCLFFISASSFRSQYLLLFPKSLRNCVLLLLPTPFTSIIFISMASLRRQFLLSIWPIQLTFLLKILFWSVLWSLIRPRTCSLVTFSDYFIFSIFLQHHISKLSEYFRSNFLSIQVSEPFKTIFHSLSGLMEWWFFLR